MEIIYQRAHPVSLYTARAEACLKKYATIEGSMQFQVIVFKPKCNYFRAAPYIILQPTRPISNSLIDNSFLNTLEYNSTSGNITIQLSDHLFQFVILEGFFKDLPIPKLNIYQQNFKYFNEREFQEYLNGINWDNILSLNASDPNLSMNNFYNQINILLDEVAPIKK